MIPGSPATTALRLLLTELASTGHTGALHVAGRPGGVVFLVNGRITHAETPASPGIGERLVTSGRIAEATWRQAYEAGHAQRQVGPLLVRQGHLVLGELACRVLAWICDATDALAHGSEAPFSFVPGERHWLGAVTEMELTTLSREIARRRLTAAYTPAASPPPSYPGPAVAGPAVAGPAVAGPAVAGPAVAGPATAPNGLPMRRVEPRPTNTGPQGAAHNDRRPTPDYATLKRIRQALKAVD